MKEKKKWDFMEIINAVTFHLAMGAFFGNDMQNLPTQKFDYEHSNGTVKGYPLSEFFVHLNVDCVTEFVHPVTNLFTFISDKNLINPWKRNGRNLTKFREAIKDMAIGSKDPNSLWAILRDHKELTDDEKFNDLFLFIVAGSDTTAHTLCSFMYLLKKSPEKLAKLKVELAKHGITGGDNVEEQITFENILDVDYLSYCFKEALRMDTAVPFSFYYQAKCKTNICNVPVDKGTLIKFSFTEAHYNKDTWLEPLKFIPERFDTESEFYQESKKQGKIFNSYSRRSFGLGPRKCPGESFAHLSVRIVVAYMVTMMDYDMEQKLLDSTNVGFAMGSHIKPIMTLKE
eukprot:CAMPEP_0205819602 /NCGR_PEP_ID=MMETSP0206-20130828/2041_1 /ASSEMBLY_ACC=CAM_ASM_000279 /TAXON_ID=36767 /ORGANISM="Euplotes focardii, Strain TN1" /LENGTH=342 /DNA_ID=CAMNT_0053113393 /DNA_START=531 /DNA_END=1559 /DNA_ORIENTATION=-